MTDQTDREAGWCQNGHPKGQRGCALCEPLLDSFSSGMTSQTDRERIEPMNCDIIGGFPYAASDCKGCGKPLIVDNAWMTDGCPCNSLLGINSMNETRWRLLMELQQSQSRQLEPSNEFPSEKALKAAENAYNKVWAPGRKMKDVLSENSLEVAIRAAYSIDFAKLRHELEEASKVIEGLTIKLGKEHTELEEARRRVEELDRENIWLRVETKCLACGCSTPEDAESKECGCESAICSRTIPLAHAFDTQRQTIEAQEHAITSWIVENEKWKEQRDLQQQTIEALEKALGKIASDCEQVASLEGLDVGEVRAWKSVAKTARAALASAIPSRKVCDG